MTDKCRSTIVFLFDTVARVTIKAERVSNKNRRISVKPFDCHKNTTLTLKDSAFLL